MRKQDSLYMCREQLKTKLEISYYFYDKNDIDLFKHTFKKLCVFLSNCNKLEGHTLQELYNEEQQKTFKILSAYYKRLTNETIDNETVN